MLTTDVAPTGGTGTFTWLWESSPNNSVWSPISGAANESYQPVSLTSTTYYRRKVINPCGSGYTNTVVVTVRPDLIAGSISNSQTICYNTAPALLVTSSLPTGGTGSFTYQWQNSVNNSTWNNISGATSETYSPGVMTSSLYFRRSETSGSCGTVQSNSVQIIVNSPLVGGSVKIRSNNLLRDLSGNISNKHLPRRRNGCIYLSMAKTDCFLMDRYPYCKFRNVYIRSLNIDFLFQKKGNKRNMWNCKQ
ncbi:MAG: hypothetical protein IPJ16_00015 [Bacteroidales bacterium]|nr:hypothetical protein [Bacteroidales bacterium]